MPKAIILDGITIQLAGELLFDVGTNLEERRRTSILYRHALWDIGFAVLFAETLGFVGSLGERKGASPGEQVIKFDRGAVFREKLEAAPGTVEETLRDPIARRIIDEDLRSLSTVFGSGSEHVSLWSEYIQNEAETNLTGRPVPNPNKENEPGANYLFPARKLVYLRDEELQGNIDDRFVNTLVLAISQKLPARKKSDLDEFVRRVLLNHYTISQWYEKSAVRSKFIRMPFGTRSAVRYRRALEKSAPGSDAEWFHRRRGIDIRLRTTALTDVFLKYRSPLREDIYSSLIDRRDRFTEHRECLDAIDWFSQENNYSLNELKKARDSLDKLLGDNEPHKGFHDAESEAAFRLFQYGGYKYPEAAYHVFPELNPMSEQKQHHFNRLFNFIQLGIGLDASRNKQQIHARNLSESLIQGSGRGQKQTQTTDYSEKAFSELAALIVVLDSRIEELHIDSSQRPKADAQINVIKNELAGNPNSERINTAGRSLRSIIEQSIANMIASTLTSPNVWIWVLDSMHRLF